jgi:hypothetical protein
MAQFIVCNSEGGDHRITRRPDSIEVFRGYPYHVFGIQSGIEHVMPFRVRCHGLQVAVLDCFFLDEAGSH